MQKTKELFDKWNDEKILLDLKWNSNIKVKVWEIWITKIWVNIWWENSKDWKFSRPVLVISIWIWWDLIWIIPFTGWYNINFERTYFKLNNSMKYWLEKESNLLLNQFKTISKKRLLYKINNLSTKGNIKPIIWSNILKLLNTKLKKLFKI